MTDDDRLAEMNRKRVKRYRDNKRQEGLVKLEVWIKPELREKLLDYAKNINANCKSRSSGRES